MQTCGRGLSVFGGGKLAETVVAGCLVLTVIDEAAIIHSRNVSGQVGSKGYAHQLRGHAWRDPQKQLRPARKAIAYQVPRCLPVQEQQ